MNEQQMWSTISDVRLEAEQRIQKEAERQRILLRQFVALGIGIYPFETEDMRRTSVFFGRLGNFEFYKSDHAYYYSVIGKVPLAVALMLYNETRLGREKIRVDGHCACPAPVYPWVNRWAPDGREVILAKNLADFQKYELSSMAATEDDPFHPKSYNAKYIFSDEPVPGETQSVDVYHIDSFEALTIFVSTLRREGVLPHRKVEEWCDRHQARSPAAPVAPEALAAALRPAAEAAVSSASSQPQA